MIITLIGYMASGKSTLGKELAVKLDYDFIDLDDYIEVKENTSVSNIFKTKGEIYFRTIETKYLKTLIESKSNLILSLGGGTPCYGNNMNVLLNAPYVKSIYLKASIPTLVARLKNEKRKRPLIAHLETDEQLTEFIGKHLFERTQFYTQAQLTLLTDNKDSTTIVNEIVGQLIQ
ncbi:shikimate kinase [Snuella sedimenti]|uniref:Shikimate kinase n=1 Tax=Snuella sedimenti TaxID=2798802 RepID=A0A8J7IG77_9FLAO|nr:shikimate kinase [Snuella sedimenti]MBJ6368837.1 shikimate kinase [Snuella sedimenti]